MTTVLIDGGRQVDTADYIDPGNVGALANGLAADVLDASEEAEFSLKVNGVVLKPEASTPTFTDTDVVELVEVTEYVWPDDRTVDEDTDELVDLEETGTLVDETPDPDAVPDGTIDEILAWIGARRDRADAALDTERAAANPRTTLIEQLEQMIDGAGD